MPKFIALTAVVLAFLVVPALAAAAPTGTEISAPATTAYVTVDTENPGSLHVAGTTVGGTGNVDLRCYYGGTSELIAGQVPVSNGSFSTDAVFNKTLVAALGSPQPFCMLRAVPTGTAPVAPPDLPSSWQGVFVGWGQIVRDRLGTLSGPNAPDTQYDYFLSRAQSGAVNDYYSLGSCGLCDTYLFVPGSMQLSNPIWWANSGLYSFVNDTPGRSSVRIDGADAYTSGNAYYNGGSNHLADSGGYPAVSETHTVDPATGDLTVDEHGRFVQCAEDRSVYPATESSCANFAATGVDYERTIRQTDSGHVVTIVDHWKSADGKPHDLDAIYDDSARSENAAIAGHDGRANFTWTQAGFYAPVNAQIEPPSSYPATMLVKTDASTSPGGDNKNPVGAQVFGSRFSGLKVLHMGNASNQSADWQTNYQRTIPAGGEVSIAVAYVADFSLASVQSLRQSAETAVAPPSIGIDSPADGSSVDAGSVHVTGSASSPDGQVGVKVNGADAAVGSDGRWSADVPLGEGVNQILAVASNKLGVTSNAIVSVTRPAATPAPAAAAVVAAKPVRCIVPKLRGKTVRKAGRLLKRAHCRLGKVTRKASTKVKPGRVIKSRFKAGTRHRAGTRVRVTVASDRR